MRSARPALRTLALALVVACLLGGTVGCKPKVEKPAEKSEYLPNGAAVDPLAAPETPPLPPAPTKLNEVEDFLKAAAPDNPLLKRITKVEVGSDQYGTFLAIRTDGDFEKDAESAAEFVDALAAVETSAWPGVKVFFKQKDYEVSTVFGQ